MSCPMVAGAAALLLELFPYLNPYMVRIALMEGAESLGYSPNIEGAGRLDLNASYHFLLNAAPDFNISIAFPKQLPIPPYEFSMFPGDTYRDEIIILSGKNIDMKVECTGNISAYISLKNTTNNALVMNNNLLYIDASDDHFTDISVIFNIPLIIQPGYYSGVIQITDNATSQLMQRVELLFQVISPRGRIYFDSFHNSDYFDNVRSNYYNFTRLLFENSIQITYGTSLLSFPLLSQYDILILPDIELPLTQKEMTAIAKYWDSGGNILILGSSYPQIAIESLNNLLRLLDVGINYTKDNLENSYDIGVQKFYGDFLITDIKGHPITQGIPYFTWLNGVALQVNPLKGAVSLATYLNSVVFAINNQSASHKLVCVGAERFFYDDFIGYSYNQQMVWQSIEWLLNNSQKSNIEDLRVEVTVSNPIFELGSNNRTTVGFFVSNPNTGDFVNNLLPHLNLSCQVSYTESGLWTPVWVANASNVVGLGQGAYYFNFSSNSEGLYRINVTIANLTSLHKGIGVTYFNNTISMPQIVIYSLKTTIKDAMGEYDDVISNDVFRNADQVIINLTIRDDNSGFDIRNVSCYITALDTFRSDIKYVQVEMQNLTPRNTIETNYSLVFSPDYSYPAGYYNIFIETLDANGYSDYSCPVLEFYVNDKYPIIDATRTKLNGASFENLQMQYAPPEIQAGMPFSIEIMGNDTESPLQNMHAYVAIFSYFIVGFYAYLYEPLWGAEIPFITDQFSGSLTLPSNGISHILEETYSLSGRVILLVVLLDSDGQYEEDSYTAILISINQPFDYSLIIIISIICMAAVAGYFIYSYLRKKRKMPEL